MTSEAQHILVVEDNPTTRAALEIAFTRAGFLVTTAANATEGFRLAEEKHFDVVVSDYYMPDHTGADLVRSLRETDRYAGTPAILLTARAHELNVEYLSSSLSVVVVSKPCSLASAAASGLRR